MLEQMLEQMQELVLAVSTALSDVDTTTNAPTVGQRLILEWY